MGPACGLDSRPPALLPARPMVYTGMRTLIKKTALASAELESKLRLLHHAPTRASHRCSLPIPTALRIGAAFVQYVPCEPEPAHLL